MMQLPEARMKIQPIALFALAAALAVAPTARADSFDFTFSDGSVSGSGTLFGTFEGPGVWLLTSGSGTFDDGATGLLPIDLVANPNGPGNSSLSTSGLFAYDDLLTPWGAPAQVLTINGIDFTFNSSELNLYQTGGGPGTDGWFEDNLSGDTTGTFTITSMDILPSESPEPGSLVLFGTGLIGLAGALMRKGRHAVQRFKA